jgi:uncharacterized protein (AIM24 family)
VRECKKMDDRILLVNLETGETIQADPYAMKDHGRPDGFVEAETVTTEQWVAALQRAIASRST